MGVERDRTHHDRMILDSGRYTDTVARSTELSMCRT